MNIQEFKNEVEELSNLFNKSNEDPRKIALDFLSKEEKE